MAYAFVQSGNTDSLAAVATVTLTPSITVTAGNLLVVFARANTTQAGIITCTDGTNTYTYSVPFGNNGAGVGIFGFYAVNIAAGTFAPVVTGSGTTVSSIYVAEYSGLAIASPFLNAAGATQNGPGAGTDAITSGNVNVTGQPAMLVALTFNLQTHGGGTDPEATAGTGFTHRAGCWTQGSGSAQNSAATEDRRITSIGNFAGTFSQVGGGGADDFTTLAMAFGESGSQALPVASIGVVNTVG